MSKEPFTLDTCFCTAAGIPKEQKFSPNPREGIRWIYQAATNLYPQALHYMSSAYQQGLGVRTNFVQAYAWQQLYVDSSPGSIVGEVELNQMAPELETAVIRDGQKMAAEFKLGNWQLAAAELAARESALTLKGLVGGNSPLAIINGNTFVEGESQSLTGSGEGSMVVKCLKIEKDYVLVFVEGESAPQRLMLK